MDSTATRRARRIPVEREGHAANTLVNAHYIGSFAADVPGATARSPEAWGRRVFEGAPLVLRGFLLVGWRAVLGLRLGPQRSPHHVLGWRIIDSTAVTVTLEARSGYLSAHKLLRVEDSRLVLTTFVRYERPWARLLWAVVAMVHHRTEPFLLTRAVSRP